MTYILELSLIYPCYTLELIIKHSLKELCLNRNSMSRILWAQHQSVVPSSALLCLGLGPPLLSTAFLFLEGGLLAVQLLLLGIGRGCGLLNCYIGLKIA